MVKLHNLLTTNLNSKDIISDITLKILLVIFYKFMFLHLFFFHFVKTCTVTEVEGGQSHLLAQDIIGDYSCTAWLYNTNQTQST